MSNQAAGPTLTPEQSAALERFRAATAALEASRRDRAGAALAMREAGLSLAQMAALTGLDRSRFSQLIGEAQNSGSSAPRTA